MRRYGRCQSQSASRQKSELAASQFALPNVHTWASSRHRQVISPNGIGGLKWLSAIWRILPDVLQGVAWMSAQGDAIPKRSGRYNLRSVGPPASASNMPYACASGHTTNWLPPMTVRLMQSKPCPTCAVQSSRSVLRVRPSPRATMCLNSGVLKLPIGGP